MKSAEQLHRVPNTGTVNHHGCRSHGHADERVQGHGRGQSNGLSYGLRPLVAREPGKVRYVQGHGGPEANHAIQRGYQELKKIRKISETRRSGKHGTESAGI